MISADTIKQHLPPDIAARVRSVRLKEDVATLVADAGGLGRAEAAALQERIEQAAGGVPGVREVRVALMADKVQRRIVAVGSGKGGVGKSTLTANLAVALARMGRKVGVVDADIYGPSQPVLLDAADRKPSADGKQLIPVESDFGVKLLSMGQLVAPGKAIAWRGPMTGGALGQLMDAQWGDTELLLVDLPPGTGDVQLTMLQKFKPTGAIVVSTPQDLALIDATRALDLFRQTDTPIIGIVENMAGYICPHCGEASDPFGSGGAEAAARAVGETFLGRIPLAMSIRIASDAGQPPAANDGLQGEPFAAIAARLAEWLDRT
ncbi:MAG: Mrp/NBP35 family ATP-binding protein [Altererythrobacter sp.]|nr:Mrp/NBP35 family ATP-binding protein [Altererythrobacter sp.]